MRFSASTLSAALLLITASNAQFIPGQCLGAEGPICEQYETVLAAAQAAMAVYNAAGVSEAITDEGDVKSAVQMVDDSEAGLCTVAYRGKDEGFEWIGDIDMRLAYMSVKDRKKQRCRVVRHYKDLYTQRRGYEETYKDEVDAFIGRCSSDGREIILTGHGLGGAIATMAALDYAKMPDLQTFVFGSPPVFMPPQYENPARLGKAARKKHPCRPLNGDTYTTFVNAGLTNGGTFMYYDFMPYLNFAIYFHQDDEGSGVTPFAGTCFDDAVAAVEAFEASGERGNLGSMYGSRYLIPDPAALTTGVPEVNYLPVDRWSESLKKHPKRNVDRPPPRNLNKLVSFGNQGINYVLPGFFNAPELLTNTGCTAADVPTVHSMARYLAEVALRGPESVGGRLNQGIGLEEGAVCLMNTDCRSKACLVDTADQRDGACKASSSRAAQKKPKSRNSK